MPLKPLWLASSPTVLHFLTIFSMSTPQSNASKNSDPKLTVVLSRDFHGAEKASILVSPALGLTLTLS